MEQTFAISITPVIKSTLELLNSIVDSSSDWDLPGIKGAQEKIVTSIKKAEQKLKSRDQQSWDLVLYALVAWIDEQCISLPWSGRDWWRDHSLEFRFFRTRNGHNDFFLNSRNAISRRDRNGIEASFLSVILGFRGVYMDLRSEDEELRRRAQKFIYDLQFKEDLREWLSYAGGLLPVGQGSTNLEVVVTEGYGAPPMSAKLDFISSAIFGVVSVGILIGYVALSSQQISELLQRAFK